MCEASYARIASVEVAQRAGLGLVLSSSETMNHGHASQEAFEKEGQCPKLPLTELAHGLAEMQVTVCVVVSCLRLLLQEAGDHKLSVR